jgi:hypothetical protein
MIFKWAGHRTAMWLSIITLSQENNVESHLKMEIGFCLMENLLERVQTAHGYLLVIIMIASRDKRVTLKK